MTAPHEPGPRDPVVVPEQLWRTWSERHAAAVDSLTGDHLERRRRGQPHPVHDFLFTYYRTSVGTVRRWHPGPGLLLENAHHSERVGWRHYRADTAVGRRGLVVDADSVRRRCSERIDRARVVVESTLHRPGVTDCFGLHEWAMLYRAGDEGVRHDSAPLRLSHETIDEVVRTSRLRCTHFDAFRFFTGPAEPLNENRLTRDDQAGFEQPACLHAGMDVYSWTAAMESGAPGELLVDSLRAAFAAREVDMRSSPYDLTAWGLMPIPVESAAGRAEFVRFQQRWMRKTAILRHRFLAAMDRLDAHTSGVQTFSAPNVRTATSVTTRPNSA